MAILIQYANGVPGVKFVLDQAEITIGRALTNDISIDDEFVSKHHAVIQLVQDEATSQIVCILIDNESTNHTYVNNVKVSAHQLDENDKVYIGQNEFRFSAESAAHTGLDATYSGFFADDAPGLMHAKIEQSILPTASFEEFSAQLTSLSDLSFAGYDEEITLTQDQRGKTVPTIAIADTPLVRKPENDENKRFSRRLSLL